MRLLWETFQPSTSLLLLFALGLLLTAAGHRRIGRWLLLAAGIPLAAILALPVSNGLLVALETRFPQPVLPERVDGIIMLGGALNSHATDRWGRPQINHHGERLFEAMVLARRYPDATLLISGGHYDADERLPEAAIARQILRELRQMPKHVVFEDKSRTTWENGVLSREAVGPRPGQNWVLVTSAAHMPRAVGVFRKLGWEVIPYPVDYQSDGTVRWRFNSAGYQLAAFDSVAREWMALIVYRLEGKSSALFPG
ncbi:MAG: YdcF family protein [Sphingomonadales bacterium]